jgi:hypothetical protein
VNLLFQNRNVCRYDASLRMHDVALTSEVADLRRALVGLYKLIAVVQLTIQPLRL